tara:strand:- start:642 stop:860 length:219 start_codon:yes stop_codon:yes gene_type:complete
MFNKYIILVAPLISFAIYRHFTKNKFRNIKNNRKILTSEKKAIRTYKPGLKTISEVENEDNWDIYDKNLGKN